MASRKSGDSSQNDVSGVSMDLAENNPELGRSVLHALRNTGIAVLYQDPALCVVWAQNVPGSWSLSKIEGKTDHQFLPELQADRMVAAKNAVLASADPERLEISTIDEGMTRWFNVWIDADRTAEGTVRGIITTAVETTDHKRREQTLKALLREVSHRSKNLLAIIQSIATQTGRYSGTIEGFLSRFRGRLQSLASSQDLVTSSNWRGADLHELVFGQVGKYVADARQSIRLEGENPYLNPNAALHIGLAVHELAVNSISHEGALARPNGFATVAARLVTVPPDGNALSLTWTEAINAFDRETATKRFGSVALERVVPASLNGSARIDIEGNTLEYRLLIPEGNFEID